jgi:hypothetical protein
VTIYLIPEAGGDAGVGVQSIASKMGIETVRVDSCTESSDVPVPRGLDFADILEMEIDGRDAVVLPTSEVTTPVYLELERKGVVSGWFSELAYEVSRDKKKLAGYDWAQSTSVKINGPFFRKPRSGSGSRGCLAVAGRSASFAEESVYFDVLREPYCVVDLIEDQTWTRRVLRQKGGSDVDMFFESDSELEEIARRVSWDLKAPVLNVQFMYDEFGKPWVIDLAPRFSGASSCLIHAGVNILSALLDRKEQSVKPRRVRRVWEEI